MTKISRRDVMAGAGAAAFVGTGVFRAVGQPKPNDDGWIVLDAQTKDVVIDGATVRLRTYNGQLPGPPIKTAAGETLRIRVRNSLPPYDSHGWDGNHDVPHALDTTNLHVHGLDVAPHLFEPLGTSNPTAPMIAIRPGAHKDYVFEIPKDHPPGLYWYHPHHHGSTAVQAVTGMAGTIIVTGAIDEVPEIKAARDIVLAIQDIGVFPSDNNPNLWTYDPKQNSIWQTFGGDVTVYDPATGQTNPTNPPQSNGFTTGDYKLRYFLLNGTPFFKEAHNQDKPAACPNPSFPPQQCPIPTQLAVQRITMAPGEVVRFRMLNANSDNMMPIVVEGHAMHLLAMDGRNFPEVRTIPALPINGSFPAPNSFPSMPIAEGTGQVLLAPANRAEFLIKAVAAPGIYRIVQLGQTQQFLASAPKIIAEIQVTGPAKDMALPARLPVDTRYYPLIKPSEIKYKRTFQFSGIFPGVVNPVVGFDLLVNNAQYQEAAVPTTVNLNDAEEWHIVVGDNDQGGTEGHPFHIHVNGFEVISIGTIPQPPGLIQDTVWVTVNTKVVIRTKFKQFTGKSVLHCHILPHEDTGMMQNFLILDGADPSRH
jgi:FtsP/CotA-like multicopper oxidase with cupredoxin domain